MKGNAAIFVVIGILLIIFIGVILSRGYLSVQKSPGSPPTSQYQSLSEDPKYKDVKDKYNLSEEQLQILSTVNPNDNN
jgi:hypothetical protein